MTAERPWMKFYPQDWRADEKLRMCSLGARGLWIEMLSLMHRSERYGTLLIHSKAPSLEQLAVQVGASVHVVSEALAELETAGVFSRNAQDAIYSRRMKRDEKKIKNAHKNGSKGGNPKLRASNGKTKENPVSDNQEDNPEDNGQDKAHMPEARSQRPERREYIRPSESAQSLNGRTDEIESDQVEETAYQLCEMAGIALSAPGTITAAVGVTREWLAAGFDVETTIKPVIQRMVASRNGSTTTLRRFDKAIRNEHAQAARHREAEAPRPVPVEEQIRLFEESARRMSAIGRDEDADEFRRRAENLRVAVE
jgi:hypothetical protein